jgi:muconolactone delta-isomerase
MTTTVPDGTPEQTVAQTEAGEAVRARELAGQGHLMRLWVLPGQRRALGLWSAADADSMQAVFESLPLHHWLTIDTVPLSPHPSDPALTPGLTA